MTSRTTPTAGIRTPMEEFGTWVTQEGRVWNKDAQEFFRAAKEYPRASVGSAAALVVATALTAKWLFNKQRAGQREDNVQKSNGAQSLEISTQEGSVNSVGGSKQSPTSVVTTSTEGAGDDQSGRPGSDPAVKSKGAAGEAQDKKEKDKKKKKKSGSGTPAGESNNSVDKTSSPTLTDTPSEEVRSPEVGEGSVTGSVPNNLLTSSTSSSEPQNPVSTQVPGNSTSQENKKKTMKLTRPRRVTTTRLKNSG